MLLSRAISKKSVWGIVPVSIPLSFFNRRVCPRFSVFLTVFFFAVVKSSTLKQAAVTRSWRWLHKCHPPLSIKALLVLLGKSGEESHAASTILFFTRSKTKLLSKPNHRNIHARASHGHRLLVVASHVSLAAAP